MSPWLYYASFKSAAGERAWLHTESAINYKIRTRMLSTVNDESPLLFFDGAAMQNYRYPSRFIENVHCLGSLRSELCSVVEKEATDLTPKVDLCLALSHQVRWRTEGDFEGFPAAMSSYTLLSCHHVFRAIIHYFSSQIFNRRWVLYVTQQRSTLMDLIQLANAV